AHIDLTLVNNAFQLRQVLEREAAVRFAASVSDGALAAIELALAAIAQDGRARCVDVAAASLAAEGFIAEVQARLSAAPEAAARLWLEVAEGPLAALTPQLRLAAQAWRACGARVGIEHAGQSLQALSQGGPVGLDYVKIDARFVRGAAADAAVHEYARGLVTLVHGMGLRVIAEGIDDGADLAVLWATGFDGATGPAVRAAGGA
ncbi:MAG: EAL domain-containing protein, partial [Rubrivivax sp.]|nr:EAL domain-containing protein [Rubrivivax sp.]